MATFKENKNVSDRSASDRRRHKEKIEKAIKEGIHDIVAEESIIGQSGKKKIKIPVRGIKEYQFIFGRNQGSKGVGSAQGQYIKKGQKIKDGQKQKAKGTQHNKDKITKEDHKTNIREQHRKSNQKEQQHKQQEQKTNGTHNKNNATDKRNNKQTSSPTKASNSLLEKSTKRIKMRTS